MIRHIITLIILAAIAVLLPLPFSVLDIFTIGTNTKVFDLIFQDTKLLNFILSLSISNPTQKFYLDYFGSIIFETLWAIPTFFLSYKLSRLFIRRKQSREKLEDVTKKFKKRSDFIILLASATPFPFTFTIYAAGILNYDWKRMTWIILIGRVIKYTIWLGLPYWFGLDLSVLIPQIPVTDLILSGVILLVISTIYIIRKVIEQSINKRNTILWQGGQI